MTTEAPAHDWYAEACRRARAYGRRRAAAGASTEWPAFAPPVALSEGPLGAVQAADREIGRQAALRARAVAEFAASRPASADRAQGEPGAMSAQRWHARPEVLRPVSEWAGRELMVALSLSAQAADALLTRSLTLVHRLPGTLAALEAGALHPGHLWTMLEKVAPIIDDRVRAEVEAGLLRWAAGRVVAPAQLGAKARREVLKRNARAAARDLQRALKERGVHLRPDTVDGMGTLTVVATMPEVQALYRALAACADSLDDSGGDNGGDSRTRGQKMVDCLLDLVLRPGECDLPPVQVLLTMVASIGTLAGGDDPGEIDGHVVPAELIRQLLTALLARRQSPPAPERDGEQDGWRDEDAALWEETLRAELAAWGAETERRVLAGEPVDDDALADPDPTSGDEASPLPGSRFDDIPDDLRDPLGRERPDAPPAAPPEKTPPEKTPPEKTPPEKTPPEKTPPEKTPPEKTPPEKTPAEETPPEETPPEETPPEETPAEGTPPDQAGASGSTRPEEAGRWAAADRAVDDASLAMVQARRKLAHAQQLVRAAAAADDADEAAWQGGPAGRLIAAEDAITALLSTTDTQRDLLAELLTTTGGGGLADRPRIALTDALSGALLALTDLPGLIRTGTCGRPSCRRHPAGCTHDLSDRPGLAPPGPTAGYRPAADLDRWVRARDRRCRFPGCRRRVPRGGELDHHRPHPDGPTSATNLVGYCTTDHRGKHQAPGWAHHLDPDGTLTVTTPTGLVAATTPPPY